MEKEVKGLSDKLMVKLCKLPDYEVLFVTPKFVFKVKPGESLENTYKSRLTGKGYEQIFGLHYDMTYAETAKMTTVRMFLVTAAYKHLHLGEFDWEQAFIQADIDKEIWLKVNDKRCPLNEFFKIQEGHGLKVMKSWYGLKQAGHLWRQFVDDLILEYDFELVKNEFDVCQYTCTTHPDGFMAILLFVDNAIVATTTLEQRAEFFEYLSAKSKVIDLGDLKRFLGMNINYDRVAGKVEIDMENYIDELLDEFDMTNAKPKNIPADPSVLIQPDVEDYKRHFGYLTPGELDSQGEPREVLSSEGTKRYGTLVGKVLWLQMCMRADIDFVVGVLCRYNSRPCKLCWDMGIWLLKYLKYSKAMKLVLRI